MQREKDYSYFNIQLSNHAKIRSQQRNLTIQIIHETIQWGHEEYLFDGRYRYIVGWREARKAKAKGYCLHKALGAVVICSFDDGVITVWWDKSRSKPRMSPYIRSHHKVGGVS